MDHHLRAAGPSGRSFAKASPSSGSFTRGQFIQMIVCKRPVYPDDHLQEAHPPDDHLQEASPSG